LPAVIQAFSQSGSHKPKTVLYSLWYYEDGAGWCIELSFWVKLSAFWDNREKEGCSLVGLVDVGKDSCNLLILSSW